jgi:hypothetical protein
MEGFRRRKSWLLAQHAHSCSLGKHDYIPLQSFCQKGYPSSNITLTLVVINNGLDQLFMLLKYFCSGPGDPTGWKQWSWHGCRLVEIPEITCMAWRTVEFSKQWKDNGIFRSLDRDWMACRTVRFSKQWKDNGTFVSLNHDWMAWRTVRFSKQWKDNETFVSLNHDQMAHLSGW